MTIPFLFLSAKTFVYEYDVKRFCEQCNQGGLRKVDRSFRRFCYLMERYRKSSLSFTCGTATFTYEGAGATFTNEGAGATLTYVGAGATAQGAGAAQGSGAGHGCAT